MYMIHPEYSLATLLPPPAIWAPAPAGHDIACARSGQRYIVEVLGDEAIEEYGRDDLYDVFRMIMPFGPFKACESNGVTLLTESLDSSTSL